MACIADTPQTRTLRFRVKARKPVLRLLSTQAFGVNRVWNYCNELSLKHFERKREFLSAYDMQPYTKGAGKELFLLRDSPVRPRKRSWTL